jgi:hypothetical protein
MKITPEAVKTMIQRIDDPQNNQRLSIGRGGTVLSQAVTKIESAAEIDALVAEVARYADDAAAIDALLEGLQTFLPGNEPLEENRVLWLSPDAAERLEALGAIFGTGTSTPDLDSDLPPLRMG